MSGRIRIIGGQWRGRKLSVADSPGLRPTGDRARETLFNWLGARVHGARCLDLFAGTGALGLEAASRGAREVVLVERDRNLVETLRSAVSSWPGAEVVSIVQADALAWLEQDQGRFDLVFVDPPFGQSLQEKALERLARPGVLGPDSLVYVENQLDGKEPTPANDDTWVVDRHKTQGRITLSLLRLGDDVAEPL